AAGGAEELVAVDEGRFAVLPAADAPLEVLAQVLAPLDLALGDLAADEVPLEAERVDEVAVHGGGATRAGVAAPPALYRRQLRRPQLLAFLRLGQGEEDFLVLAVAHEEDAPGRDARRAETDAEVGRLPELPGAFLGPVLQESLLLRDGGAVLALPLRPVELPGRERIGGRRRRQRETAGEDRQTPETA